MVDRVHTGHLRQLNRIIIKTTGVPDPSPILQALLSHSFLMHALSIDAVLATFDTVSTLFIFERYPEIQK
ncbi:hypothetical protein MF1_12690 [Bartonella quintana]|nr:hypothetical protein RM11_1218 [Bartonella quintana RM-11]BBL54011.1 hypothetical protein MF1_12690 [Bartonella quintana]